MATNTLLPDSEEKTTNPNESDEVFRSRHGVAKGLEDLENYANSGGNNSEPVGNQEENPNTPHNQPGLNNTDGYRNNFTGGGSQSPNRTRFLRKKGPIGLIITLILGGGIGIVGLSSQGLLLVHIKEMFVNKYDAQNTSMTIRSNRVVAKMIAGDVTSGACTKVVILCKFTRPSSKLLRSLDQSGIHALDASGKPIDPKSWINPLPNTRPQSYQFTDGAGKPQIIKASDFYNTINTNSEFRSAFHKAYNPRFIGYADSVFKSIETRFGFDKRNKTGSAKDSKSVTEEINSTKGTDTGAKAAASEGDAAATKALRGIIGDTLTKSLDKLSKSGKGSGTQLIATGVCMLTDVPGIITSAARAYQMVQLIQYAYTFLNIADAIKSGDATQQQVSAAGGLLTAVVAGKSAMDSFGMKYSLFGDTKPQDSGYKKFVPGGAVMGTLAPTMSVTDSTVIKDSCGVATNPATGAALNAVLVANSGETFGATAIIAGLNWVGGVAIGTLIGVATPQIVDFITKNFLTADMIKSMLGFFFGDLTQNLSGQSVGDVVASGASNMMGQTANAGGNMPLSVPDAVAYNNTSQQVQLAYAQEDQATLSPLDASSSNTFIGSIINHLLPYYSNLSSLTGVMSSVASLATSSFGSLFQTHAASNDSAQYQLCDDPTIKDRGIAAGPFCNIQYGVPTQYLNNDPEDVVNYMINNNYIDPSTGDAVAGSDYEQWLGQCTDGTAIQANSCQISDDQHVNFSLYTIDHRIQKTISGDDPAVSDLTNRQGDVSFYSTNDNSPISMNAPSNTTLSTVVASRSSINQSPTACKVSDITNQVVNFGVLCNNSYLGFIKTKGSVL